MSFRQSPGIMSCYLNKRYVLVIVVVVILLADA